ncbi:MAG: tetratricopeptide repeat protein [Acidobacteria bacterium]|nr:tetratricopeptide repeat protein [Acidobacteriota bacterium]
MRTGFVCLVVQLSLVVSGRPFQSQQEGPSEESLQRWVGMMEAAQKLRQQGHYEAAYRGFEEASTFTREMPGRPVLRARSYEYLGSIAATLGRPIEAEAHYQSAIRLWEAMGEIGTLSQLQANADLLSLYVETGQTGKAERLAKRLAADSEGKLGADATAAGRVQIALAAAAYLNGDLDRAESLCRQAIKAKELDPTITPEERSQAYNQLGLILWQRNRRAAGLQQARTAVEILEKNDRTHSIEYAAALGNQAMMSSIENGDRRAPELMRRAIEVVRTSVGTGHVFLAELLVNYAGMLKQSRRGDESKAAQREAQQIFQQTLVQQPGHHTVDVADLMRANKHR